MTEASVFTWEKYGGYIDYTFGQLLACIRISINPYVDTVLNMKNIYLMYFSNLCHININNESCLNLDSKELLKILTAQLSGDYFILSGNKKLI